MSLATTYLVIYWAGLSVFVTFFSYTILTRVADPEIKELVSAGIITVLWPLIVVMILSALLLSLVKTYAETRRTPHAVK